MAEICLDCWNEINDANYTKRDYILSKELCLCEECGEYKQVIIAERTITPDVVVCGILLFPFTILILVYKLIELIYNWIKYK